jgi:hypothetical protein
MVSKMISETAIDSQDEDSETFRDIINYKWKLEQAMLPTPLNTDEEDGRDEKNKIKI